MAEQLHIISSCVIDGNKVLKNDALIYSPEVLGVRPFLLQLYQHVKADYPKFYKMDNLSKFGFLAAEILLSNELLIKQYKPEEIGLLITNANASLEADMKYFQTIAMASPALFVYTLPNILIGEICIRNNFKGENACFIFEKFNAAFIKEYVDELFRENKLKLCIYGWVDMLGDNYKAALFLVGKHNDELTVVLNEEALNNIFNKVV